MGIAEETSKMDPSTPANIGQVRAVALSVAHEATMVLARSTACENLNDATGLIHLVFAHLERSVEHFKRSEEPGAVTAVEALRAGMGDIWNKGVRAVNRSLSTAPPGDQAAPEPIPEGSPDVPPAPPTLEPLG